MDFKPPNIDRSVMRLCKWGLPLELWRSQISVEVEPGGLERFQRLRGQHAVIVCNHSNQYDPEVMFAFSKIAGEDFHFMAAREVFDWVLGAVGWWFQRLGCYSVVRGRSDPDAFEMTREIIASSPRKLVVFPEGEVTRSPDILLPLRPGALRLFFEGQERVLSRAGETPVFIQPLAIRWRYKHDISAWLDFIMRRIEGHLGLSVGGMDLPGRVQVAASKMLQILEQEYLCPVEPQLRYEQRVDRLRQQILDRLSHLLGVHAPDDGNQMIWLRRVLNTIDSFIHEDDAEFSKFQHRLHLRQARKLRSLVTDCRLVQHLIGVMPSAPTRPLSQERLAAIVSQIERQLFGLVLPKGPRVAYVGVGEPFSLLSLWTEYVQDDRLAVAQATAVISRRLQELLDRLEQQPQALVPALK